MKFILTCGGTAGHINPALAIAGRLRELMPDCGILFIGAEGKMEMELVPREGYKIEALKITNISRGKSFDALKHNFETLKNVAVSTHEAKRIIREYKPDAVIGTGGYVCYPVLKAAHDLGVATAVHESNAVPGLTTKLLAEHVNKVMVGFEESRSAYHHPDKVEVTGTPVRGEFATYSKAQAKRELGLDPDEPLVVSVWGSLGAAHMNKVMGELIPMLDETKEFHLI
ncbi:MAG: UDP-N-acetylglucosamine--N-acetylmuramyl-(pentapeptide) pyrophosphoryl-undecaprenol N-acetylglucosamine transferase, partial [Oscillospiraceae bacterium]|nr:UDP-N-acetylglucosamine--N-acetylmuramyl-(pentapeptide) pyrophosphoryl-undecaprenol N-acetylglucosamine transferase [Oscillospiraceae bacterium]